MCLNRRSCTLPTRSSANCLASSLHHSVPGVLDLGLCRHGTLSPHSSSAVVSQPDGQESVLISFDVYSFLGMG